MSLLDRIKELNTFDLSHYAPFVANGVRVGSIRRDRIELLRAYPDIFEVSESGIALSPKLATPKARSAAILPVVRALQEQRLVRHRRDEFYPVVAVEDRKLETPVLFEIERSAVPFFGIRAFGIHVNGFMREDSGYSLWLGRRAKNALVHPKKLDNMVAGGLPVGLTPFENMIKEAGEEAKLPPEVAKTAEACGHISYCVETPEGLGPATMFIFDLEVPREFEPENADGEIGYFELLPVHDVLRLVEEGRELKPNSNLVIIDFCFRHGILTPAYREYGVIEAGLRQ